MGKGLLVEEDALNIAFVGGTGSLVFIDLVALILRRNLDLLPPQHVDILSSKKFKFILFASFQSRYDAVGIEMMEGLEKICLLKGIKNFELVLRFSDKNAPRWDPNFIDRQLKNFSTQNLKRIWVCGPPAMNEVFDRTLEKIAP